MKKGLIAGALAAALIAACAESPTGRSQFMIVSDAEMAQMGATAYQQMKQEQPLATDPAVTRYVQCVTDAITSALPAEYRDNWDVTVFKEDSANAFALPGGKIGVHTGLLDVAVNQHQLAAVIGHEVAHVIADHGNERVSMQFAAQTGQQLVGVLLGGQSAQRDMIMGALGLGAQYGLLMPYSRIQESEADQLGLDYMADAGFDPTESVRLWQNMSAQSQGQPPEFLSTHPSHATRIQELQNMMPRAEQRYQQARAQGRTPNCRK